MFELEITDIYRAVALTENWATHTISLLDPDNVFTEIPISSQHCVVHRYYCHDAYPGTCHEIIKNPVLATPEQIQDILNFSMWLKPSDKLLIHCHAGISRSTAVACGILCQHGLKPMAAIQCVLAIREYAFPNRYIIALFDEILALEGQLSAAVAEAIDEPNISHGF